MLPVLFGRIASTPSVISPMAACTRSRILFQTLDALAHRAVGDVHLLCGVREIQVPGSRFEEAKRLKRGKCAKHTEMIAALTADAKNHRWQSSHQHSIIRIPGEAAVRVGGSDAAENNILAFGRSNRCHIH